MLRMIVFMFVAIPLIFQGCNFEKLNQKSEKDVLQSRYVSVMEFSTFVGGSREDTIRDVYVDEHGFIYVTGGTKSHDFPTTPGAPG